MSDPVFKFITKTEEPLARAQAGAYALLMASRDLDDDDERRAMNHVAWGVVLELRKIEKRWEALDKATKPADQKVKWRKGDFEPTPPRLVEPDTS